MKLECNRKDLHEALALATMATSGRTSIPILQSVRLEAIDSSLRLTGCDGEMWADRTILANVEVPGGICVPSQFCKELVSSLPDGQVHLELELSGTLVLRSGFGEWRMNTQPLDEFPNVPQIEVKSELRVPVADLRTAIDDVAFAVADDNTRPLLTGVLFIYDGVTLTMVATDTHRMAVTKIEKEGIGSPVNAIVPEKALRAIRSLPFAEEDEITVKFDETRLAVDSMNCRVVSQLLVGTYPNWERVVPLEPTRTWIVDRTEMLDNVKRAMILAKDASNRVRFAGHGEQILISARSEDKGDAKEEIAAVCKNGDVEIAFNGRFVEDALRAIRCDGVKVELTEPTRPALFRPMEEESRSFCVIMPMALG